MGGSEIGLTREAVGRFLRVAGAWAAACPGAAAGVLVVLAAGAAQPVDLTLGVRVGNVPSRSGERE